MGGSGSSSKMARELKGKSRPLAIIRLRLFRVLVNTPICRNYCRIRHSPSENECFQTVFYVNDQNRARSDPKSRKKEGAPPQNSAIFLILGIAVLR